MDRALVVRVFDEWNKRVEADPESFASPDECESGSQADYFLALVEELS